MCVIKPCIVLMTMDEWNNLNETKRIAVIDLIHQASISLSAFLTCLSPFHCYFRDQPISNVFAYFVLL
jgi:hypothetical protein